VKLRNASVYAAGVATLVYALFLCVLYFAQGSLIYPGIHDHVEPVPPRIQGVEVLKITSIQGDVEAFFLPAVTPADGIQAPLMIFAHGNGEVIDYWLTGLEGFRERGIGVLLVEYPGYGRSPGSPSEASIRAAMDAAYDRIETDPRVDRARIFGFGRSLGGGAICLLAKDRPLRALILQSTFPSLDMFVGRYWAPSFLLHDHFDNLATVRNFSGPVLVIHGRNDSLIPWREGRRLALASGRSIFRLYDCGHECWDPERLPFWHDALPFLVQAGIVQSMRTGG
jgi:uncharacterized protein